MIAALWMREIELRVSGTVQKPELERVDSTNAMGYSWFDLCARGFGSQSGIDTGQSEDIELVEGRFKIRRTSNSRSPNFS